MEHGQIALAGAAITAVALALLGLALGGHEEAEDHAPPSPALSVAVTRPELNRLPIRLPATGHIAAWQEASVGTQTDGLRLTAVNVNVGDDVKQGQILAIFNDDSVQAELAEAQAVVAQTDAEAAEAEENARRAQSLEGSGALSTQQVRQYAVAAISARARVDAAKASERRHRLRLAYTRLTAPSDGLITSRTATVGAVVPAGQELFRLIKDGRLEWRAQVAASDLSALKPGQIATLHARGHEPIHGTLRMVAPDIDIQTHNGLVYVDLPSGALRAGEFAVGQIDIGEREAMTLPQSAVLLRDGFHYVMQVGPQSNVVTRKVVVGMRIDDRIEITDGVSASQQVILSGLAFLSEGDTVRVVANDATGDGTDPTTTPPTSTQDIRATTRSAP